MFIPTETQLAVATTSGGHAGALFMSHRAHIHIFLRRSQWLGRVCLLGVAEVLWHCGVSGAAAARKVVCALWYLTYIQIHIHRNTSCWHRWITIVAECVYNTDAQRVESYYPHIARTVEYSGHISSTICCCFNNFTRSQRGIWHAFRGRRGWWCWCFCRLCVYLWWWCESIWSIGSSSTVAAAECLC